MTVKTIGILLFENVEELDAVGPWEVLSYWTLKHPEDGYEVRMLAAELAPVTAAKGLRLLPDTTLADAPPLEVLIYRAGRARGLDWPIRPRSSGCGRSVRPCR